MCRVAACRIDRSREGPERPCEICRQAVGSDPGTYDLRSENRAAVAAWAPPIPGLAIEHLEAVGHEPRNNTRPARSVRPAAVGQHNNHVVHGHLLLLTSRFCAGSGQPSVFIQLAT